MEEQRHAAEYAAEHEHDDDDSGVKKSPGGSDISYGSVEVYIPPGGGGKTTRNPRQI